MPLALTHHIWQSWVFLYHCAFQFILLDFILTISVMSQRLHLQISDEVWGFLFFLIQGEEKFLYLGIEKFAPFYQANSNRTLMYKCKKSSTVRDVTRKFLQSFEKGHVHLIYCWVFNHSVQSSYNLKKICYFHFAVTKVSYQAYKNWSKWQSRRFVRLLAS